MNNSSPSKAVIKHVQNRQNLVSDSAVSGKNQ